MKTKSGMTLIEVIISLAIFAIITVGFYGMYSTVFINMYKTSKVTESAFLTQQVIEDRIADVKAKLKNGLTSQVTDEKLSFTLFSGSNQRTISAYHLEENMVNGKLVETLVAENRPPQLRVPIITSAVIIKAKNGSTVIPYPNIALKDTYDIILEGGTPTVDNEGLLIQHLYYWYISKPGIYTVSQPPLFPDDYEILSGYTAKDIVTIPDSFAGRFLKLMVTPVGEKGAMGTSIESNSLFISPLTVTNNLLLHYDASLIDTIVAATNNEFASDKVIRWKGTNGVGDLVPTSNNIAPSIAVNEYGSSIYKRTFSVTRSSAGGSQTLTGTNSIASKNNVTVYFVAKFASTLGVENGVNLLHTNTQNRNKFILKTSTVSGKEGQLELIRYYNTNQQGSNNVINQTNYRTDNWEIIKLEVYSNLLAIRHGVNYTNNQYTFVNNVSQNITAPTNFNLSPFQINFEYGYGVGEVMVYDGVVSSSDEQLILKYLSDKYQP